MSRNAIAYLRPPGELAPAGGKPPRGLQIVDVFADRVDDEPVALVAALEAIASGAADTLYVERLSAVAGSLGELVRLLQWLDAAGASLLAADVELDTAAPAGRKAAGLLREIERWGREPEGARRRRGRPGLASGSPELAERIALLRETGLSLQAIAERLNAEGLPTPRGGAKWRPSSVQSALGYRRPRPPAPGAPPPPGHGHPGPRRRPRQGPPGDRPAHPGPPPPPPPRP